MKTTLMELEAMQSVAGRTCRLMKVLAHTERLLILCQLAQGELCVDELEERLGIVQPMLSQQLNVLRDEELVHTRREGKSVFYALSSTKAQPLMQVLHEQFCVVEKE